MVSEGVTLIGALSVGCGTIGCMHVVATQSAGTTPVSHTGVLLTWSLGRIHARVAHLRRNLLHQITTELARGYTSITVEDLNATGMLANRKLARHVSDAAFGELRRQLTYKAAWPSTAT
jgi:IS605 OrfB family transposase